jgi:putative PIN family toxin of toxin-antitoxin system
LVLDTNVALDLLVFEDASTTALRSALQQAQLRWLVLPGMRAEFERVLDYPRVLAWRTPRGRTVEAALAAFDALSQAAEPPPACEVRCTDPDDQPFIDLAVAHAAVLLSKDQAVLATKTQLAARGVEVAPRFIATPHP